MIAFPNKLMNQLIKSFPKLLWKPYVHRAIEQGLDQLYLVLSFDCDTREDTEAAELKRSPSRPPTSLMGSMEKTRERIGLERWSIDFRPRHFEILDASLKLHRSKGILTQASSQRMAALI